MIAGTRHTSFLSDDPLDGFISGDVFARFNLAERKEIAEEESRRVSLGDDGIPRPRIMTMNVHGPTPPKGGTAAMRKTMLQMILDQAKPDIILMQEMQWIGLSDHLDLSFSTPSRRYKCIRNKMGISKPPFYGRKMVDLKSRMEIALLTPQVDAIRYRHISSGPIFAVSFHGVSNGNAALCVQQMIRFLDRFARRVSEPIIIGGDWNEDIRDLELPTGASLCTSGGVRRFDTMIDHFLSFNCGTRLGCTQTVSFFDEDGQLNRNVFTAEDWKRLEDTARGSEKEMYVWEDTLDHDPIFAIMGDE
ncbi:hypothetical protein PROFUN_04531 [Planoprotostelium fungivorum]|uniref:Endonuclease/exonuclease/phosphatase domain-containing protein n=1 Tax=Planoprotostelium fungivorum TaxID=1890364 RepID=A0A2P6NBG0_9EUKA|nr:hypothetical protein PROFUN_04531 [Planoprotostelium fungivorum]